MSGVTVTQAQAVATPPVVVPEVVIPAVAVPASATPAVAVQTPAPVVAAPVVPAVVVPAPVVVPPVAVTPDVALAASAVVKPAVQAITAFQAGVVKVLNQAELTPNERLKAIQPMLETMSGAIVESAQSPPDEGTQLVAAFSAALGAELRPLVETIQLTLAQISGGGPSGSARKTYSHVGMTRPIPPVDDKPGSVRNIARRSTGLEG